MLWAHPLNIAQKNVKVKNRDNGLEKTRKNDENIY